ncbi:unnamed protein product [Candidula unifasciata]|uniref:Chitin-binding type-2 domain-containing protein n=1 Tax=Candidula unifasciata TaxID=100452 RepID=A0A8S3Z3A2_9EUPU|nr:unnamed protein product [Candidula unifasciata]
MYFKLCLLFVSVICSSWALPTDFDYDCTGLPENFLYWWACGSYGICRGGRYSQIDCVNGTSYDRRTGDCTHNSQAVTYPCNSVPEECLIYKGPGLRYPDRNADPVEALPPCTFYYTCAYGRYLGHQRCPEGTVYDEPQQRCLPPTQVSPPCGTFTGHVDGPVLPGTETVDGRQVIQPQTDTFGNVDKNKWPFTNNRNSRNQRPSPGRAV